jgi:hypothetical protein
MWINIDRISNKEPEEEEFKRMWQMFALAGSSNPEDKTQKSPYLDLLKRKNVDAKAQKLK